MQRDSVRPELTSPRQLNSQRQQARKVTIERRTNEQNSSNAAGVMLAITQRVSEQADFRRMSAALCAALQTSLQAERVSLGWQRRGADPNQPPIIVATSSGETSTLSPRFRRALIAAMDEACLQQCALSNVGQLARNRIDAAQRALAALDNRAVISIPLAINQQCVGAICIEMPTASLPAGSISTGPRVAGLARFTEQVLPSCTRLLALAAQTDAPWWHLVRARWQRENRDAQTRRRRRIWQASFAVLATALLIPFEQPVTSEARLEGAIEREVVATMAGTLESVLARPGDVVQKGQTLATLSIRETTLEVNQREAEFAEQRALMNAAIATGDRTGMAAAQARMQQTKAQLDLLNLQLQQAVVRAPLSGTVLKGDLRDKLDSPVDRGEALFTIAPDDQLRVIIEVSETDIDDVRMDQAGELALSAMPWQRFALKVTRIAPTAALIEDRNVVEVRAQLTDDAGRLKPGQLKPGQRGAVHLQSRHTSLLERWAGQLIQSGARLWWRWRPW